MNKIDNFFKNKLAGHSISPGGDSWGKVEAGLTKKNDKAIWLRVAAGILLGGLGITFWIFTQRSSADLQSLSIVTAKSIENTTAEEAINENNEDDIQELQQPQQIAKNKTGHQEYAKKEVVGRDRNKANKYSKQVSVEEVTPENILDTIDVQMSLEELDSKELIAFEVSPTEEIKAVPSIERDDKPLVIEYTLAAMPTKPKLIAEGLQKKKTGFGKMLEIAGDVRAGESSLGGLRQAKNDLLAFNFIKEERINK